MSDRLQPHDSPSLRRRDARSQWCPNPQREQLQVPAQSAVGPVVITYRTCYADEGFESPIPREFWAETRGEAVCTLEEAINAYWSIANGFVPSLAVATNAPIDDLDVHIAFDATPGKDEHRFFENFQPDETGRPRHGRSAPLAGRQPLRCARGLGT